MQYKMSGGRLGTKPPPVVLGGNRLGPHHTIDYITLSEGVKVKLKVFYVYWGCPFTIHLRGINEVCTTKKN